MSISQDCKNIVYDKWLSNVLRRDTYKIEIDEHFIKNRGGEIIKDLQPKKGVFLYSKVAVDDILAIEFLEGLGFHLIDTNIVFTQPVLKGPHLKYSKAVRFARREDEKQLVELARQSFIYSRFHIDNNIGKQQANNLKAEWVRSYFKGGRGSYMVVAEADSNIKGFLLLLKDEKTTLIIDLIAVDKSYRNKGLASEMIAYAEENCKDITAIKVGTQLANMPSICLYEKLGFRISQASYIFHYHSHLV